MFSGVITEIYKELRESTEKRHHESKAKIENASHSYIENYRKRHGQVKVFCVGMREPIPLDGIYVAVQFLNQHTVYNSPEDVEQAFRERDSSPFDSVSDEPQGGTQVANSKQYLMLLGGPGVGKSTFLRKVGLEALKGKNGNFEHECIPVFLELKRFTEDQIDIETLIVDEFKICGFPYPEELTRTALKSGKLLILFDGLDEVPTANVANVINKIRDFVDRYRQNRFIASCRIAAYKGGFIRFTEVEIADFNDSQIEAYIKNWFDSTTDPNLHQLDEQMKTAEQCWKMLNASEHSATKELARNPLLLTLLCMVYDNSQNFQRNRAALYEDALNIFLREWLAEKRVNRGASITQYLDIADEKRMLSEIAAKNFKANRFFFSEDELITQIRNFGEGNANTLKTFDARNILDTILIDQGLFVERVAGSYSFSHLTFQEYLTANYIVGHPQSIQGLVEGHLHDEQWREVFLLTSGLMYKADNLLEAMEAEAAKSINTSGLKALFQWAERITDTTDNQYMGFAKREFVIERFFLLKSLDKSHEIVKHKIISSQDRGCALDFHLNPALYSGLYPNLYLNLHPDFDPDLYEDLDHFLDLNPHLTDQARDLFLDLNPHLTDQARALEQYLAFYLHRVRDENLYLEGAPPYHTFYEPLYHDFYSYMDRDLLSFLLPEFGDRFDRELRMRVKFTERIEKMKIFKGVDFKRLIDRFKAQGEFMRAVGEGEVVKSPTESIHDTWLSILGITNDMLAISYKEMDSYIQYLRVVELIIACKEAAGRVSPDVWQRIEDRLLVCETEESED